MAIYAEPPLSAITRLLYFLLTNSKRAFLKKRKMAFMVSQSSLSETEKVNMDNSEEKDSAAVGSISSQLYLKSYPKASSQTLDKEVVLQRIRHRKSLNKFKSAFEALLGNKESDNREQKWLEQDDVFSAP